MPGSRDAAETPGRKYRLVRMTERDLDSVVAIEKACFADPWSRSSFLHEIRDNPFAENLVLREASPEGRVVAYACVWFLEDEIHINNIAVAGNLRRRGLGRRLIRDVLRRGTRRGCTAALLQVRPSNGAAIGLYRSFGFVTVGRRRGYYTRENEDALVMSLTLDGEPTGGGSG